MNKREIKTLLNRVLKDFKNSINHREIEEKYNIKIDYIEDMIFFRIKKMYEGKIEGLKKKDYKIENEIYFNFTDDLLNYWVEVKIYNFIEHDFEYITIVEISETNG